VIHALVGGVIIGIAVSVMLYFNGRVTGIAGIIGSALRPEKTQFAWRLAFLGGLVVGGMVIKLFYPVALESTLQISTLSSIGAGFLVGFGTLLGNGCTSGHGVCGISRMSIRSIISTVTFITFGILTVFIMKKIGQ